MPGTLFVGREREQQLYHKFLAKKTSWVLIITGQGGIGKSTLLHHLAEQTPHDIPVVTLDFADEALRTDPLNILERVASCVKPFCDKQQTQVFKQTLRDCHRELAALHKEAQRAIRVSERASWPGVSLRASINTVAVREVHLQVREQVTEAFYQQVDTFRPAHLVIMLDTFEWLSEPQGLELGQWVKNEFIAELQMRMQEQQQQCSFVIASRTRPSLEVISKQNQWCLDLAMLNQEGVDQYLEHIGMHDPELRQYA